MTLMIFFLVPEIFLDHNSYIILHPCMTELLDDEYHMVNKEQTFFEFHLKINVPTQLYLVYTYIHCLNQQTNIFYHFLGIYFKKLSALEPNQQKYYAYDYCFAEKVLSNYWKKVYQYSFFDFHLIKHQWSYLLYSLLDHETNSYHMCMFMQLYYNLVIAGPNLWN